MSAHIARLQPDRLSEVSLAESKKKNWFQERGEREAKQNEGLDRSIGGRA